MKAIDAKISSFIGNSERVFIIPPFQRNYTWTKDQCEELFDDIVDSIKKQTSHYIGNIVYYVGKDSSASFAEYILIDGQQRITTILLLLSAIRNLLPEDDLDRKLINKKYLMNEFGGEKYKVKLKQTESDEIIFDKILQNQALTDDEKKNNLYINFEYFIERLNELPEDISIKSFYNAVGNLDIVDLNLQIDNNLESVQKIFEKINSTGKPLTNADLIRNFLLISDTSQKQEELYNNYWVKIESLYDNKEDISNFAKHYLITKRGDWVEDKKMYKMFKSYFLNTDMTKEDILSEMLKYSKYYNWFKKANTDYQVINLSLKELNILKSDDMYSLLLVLFDKLYYQNISELIKIMGLLVDFMIRYRIVGLSNGSADLRNTLYNVLTKITSEEINPTYDEILYELSNSPSPSGRFPTDEEFASALKTKVNVSYAKALLYKMEYIKTKNIPVDINDITIEHIMPQKLNKDWINYLGGEIESAKIHNTYLNCIGNLAMLSGPYNSSNSNKSWSYKRNILKQAQFILTSDVSNFDEWKEKEIKERNKKLSNLAVSLITSPLKREKDFQTIDSVDDFVPGIYNIDNESLNVTGKSLKAIIVDKEAYPVSGWFNIISAIIIHEYDEYKDIIDEIVRTNRIHKSTSKKMYPLGKDPIFSLDKKYLANPYYFSKGNFYIEQCLSADRARYYACELLSQLGLKDKTKIDIQ